LKYVKLPLGVTIHGKSDGQALSLWVEAGSSWLVSSLLILVHVSKDPASTLAYTPSMMVTSWRWFQFMSTTTLLDAQMTLGISVI